MSAFSFAGDMNPGIGGRFTPGGEGILRPNCAISLLSIPSAIAFVRTLIRVVSKRVEVCKDHWPIERVHHREALQTRGRFPGGLQPSVPHAFGAFRFGALYSDLTEKLGEGM